MAINFEQIAQAALAQAETLCSEWLGGKRVGNEWTGAKTATGGPGDSWTVNLSSGAWMHGAGTEKGGDLTSLYATLQHLSNGEAAQQLAQRFGMNGHRNPEPNGGHEAAPRAPALAAPAPQPKRAETPALPIPAEAGQPPTKPDLQATYTYCDAQGVRLFIICRYPDAERGKRFVQWTWRGNKWAAKAYPSPRPLYGLPGLYLGSLPVLILEGEKCVERASPVLRGYTCVTWAGGAPVFKSADWSVLRNRDVVLWPDNDAPGMEAMAGIAEIMLPIASRVRIVKPSDQAAGWDVADAIDQGWDELRLIDYARAHIIEVAKREPEPAPEPDSPPPIEDSYEPDTQVAESKLSTARSLGLIRDGNQRVIVNLVNVSLVLQRYKDFTDRLWFDTFRRTVYHNFGGTERPWDDTQNRRLTTTLQQSGFGLEKVTSKLVLEAVHHCAELNQRNSVTRWLEGLTWDQTPRLKTWLADFFGAPQDEVREAIGTNWLVSMVRRAYEPGCQCDYVIVLEGEQGLGKSSVLEDLAAPWFASLSQKFASKEFNEALRGIWLIEIPDLSSFVGRDHQHIIGGISRRTDVYRVPYDRLTSEHPRQCIIAVSTEEPSEYLADTFGIRRFWPVPCTDINRGAIKAVREQLFAEAVQLYRQGHSGFETPEALKREQLERVEKDIYHERLVEYLKDKQRVDNLEVYEAIYAPTDSYGHPTRAAESKDQKRIARAMRRLGWVKTRTATERGWRRKPAV